METQNAFPDYSGGTEKDINEQPGDKYILVPRIQRTEPSVLMELGCTRLVPSHAEQLGFIV